MTLNIPKSSHPRVVIIGGGFAGLALVRKLSRHNFQVVLIDRNNHHQFQPLLYQVATAAINPGDIAFPFRKLYRRRKNVHFRMAEVLGIDPERKIILTDRGCTQYDLLVLATGSVTNYFGMENIEKESMAMKSVWEAVSIRNRVLLHIEKAVELKETELRQSLLTIVIVGGGATGVELAGAFAEMKKSILPKDYPEFRTEDIRIYLIEGASRLIGTMSEATSAETLRLLNKMGVKVILDTAVTDYAGNRVILKDGSSIPTHNLIWTSGVTVAVPDGLDKAERGKGGRLVTDDYFRVNGYRAIYAVGDTSMQMSELFPNGYPQLARVGIEQAQHLASNFISQFRGEAEKPFTYVEYPVLATVGRNKAFLEYRKFRMKGFFAWLAWAVIHLWLILGVKNKFTVFFEWAWNYITVDLPSRVIIMPKNSAAKSVACGDDDDQKSIQENIMADEKNTQHSDTQ